MALILPPLCVLYSCAIYSSSSHYNKIIVTVHLGKRQYSVIHKMRPGEALLIKREKESGNVS